MNARDLQGEDPLGRLVELLTETLLENRRDETPWMTLEQAAVYLQVSKRQVQDWRERDEIPYSKQGRAVLFHKSRLDEWLLSQPTQRRHPRCRSRR